MELANDCAQFINLLLQHLPHDALGLEPFI